MVATAQSSAETLASISYYKPDEVAAILRVSRARVCQMCVSGTLPALRVGRLWRISATALDRFIAERANGGAA